MNTNLLWQMLVGKIINRQYHLKDLIDSSCFAGVFMADEVRKSKVVNRVAIKLICSEPTEQKLEELFNITAYKHENLLDYQICGECFLNGSDFLYVVMELADMNLETHLKTKRLLENEVVDLIKDIASALDFLHTQKEFLVHRNLKPSNILRVKNTWKLADFGFMRLREIEADFYTTHFLGSPLYSPPEAYEGLVSRAWDRWSLGVLIYYILTGNYPFEGKTPQHLMIKINESEPDLSKLPTYFENLLFGCLAKDSARRWTAKDILQRLPSPETSSRDQGYFIQGNRLYEEQKYQQALEKYTQAIELNPKLTDAYNNRGVIRYVLEDFQGALEDYTQVIRLNPDFADAYNNRGVVKYDLEDYQGAIKDYNQALKLNSKFTDGYYNRGVAKYEIKDYEGAIEDFTQSIDLDPDFADAYYQRGNAYSYCGETKKAKEDFETAIELNPDYADDSDDSEEFEDENEG